MESKLEKMIDVEHHLDEEISRGFDPDRRELLKAAAVGAGAVALGPIFDMFTPKTAYAGSYNDNIGAKVAVAAVLFLYHQNGVIDLRNKRVVFGGGNSLDRPHIAWYDPTAKRITLGGKEGRDKPHIAWYDPTAKRITLGGKEGRSRPTNSEYDPIRKRISFAGKTNKSMSSSSFLDFGSIMNAFSVKDWDFPSGFKITNNSITPYGKLGRSCPSYIKIENLK